MHGTMLPELLLLLWNVFQMPSFIVPIFVWLHVFLLLDATLIATILFLVHWLIVFLFYNIGCNPSLWPFFFWALVDCFSFLPQKPKQPCRTLSNTPTTCCMTSGIASIALHWLIVFFVWLDTTLHCGLLAASAAKTKTTKATYRRLCNNVCHEV